jgi:hypothetical protein
LANPNGAAENEKYGQIEAEILAAADSAVTDILQNGESADDLTTLAGSRLEEAIEASKHIQSKTASQDLLHQSGDVYVIDAEEPQPLPEEEAQSNPIKVSCFCSKQKSSTSIVHAR